MNHQNIVMITVVGRLIACSVALIGAAQVMVAGQDGWGWLIFAGIILGAITVSKESEIKE